ncbi:peptide chain release factor N(5)-glutamine methyltransferase [Candidatus Parcubacteria bacterium]|nr:peptide chain release factor N(5)-glutamine methyltransferase [Patescibacteria group bacterium]MBU4308930.1 peptide chain release factor N(5)-glutamine methyltransferase [Patescibacteria group bacterium]MBU4431820.1 peptide chain release factor N(5)-glutamine methyltransferase [Patescibacteria group bacterium]MBU4577290.1 peptide chain release factor N(5)-glutamine methyltransferase [Patescibacteria group bacterium]MCG2696980.1 peptide chain release factor N(5)-glutamine methyltransferase [C
MTILESLKFNTEKLKAFSATPRLDTEALLCFVLDKEKEFLFTYPKTKLNLSQSGRLNKAIKLRIKGVPIAHIVGHKEFYGYDFCVNENVLVPRPETEMMIEEALQNTTNNNITLIDVGTGSGCIPITIANELKKNDKLTDTIQIFAIDISKKALFIAKKNANLYKLDHKIKFFEGNLLEPVLPIFNQENRKKYIITANLPYLTPEQVENSPTIRQEPVLALVAGNDGLQYYRELFEQIGSIKTGVEYVILCEIDASQSEGITKLIKEKLGDVKIEIKKDLAGLDRLVIIQSK